MCVNDLEKAQPKKDFHNTMSTKQTMKIDDIEGTKARARVFNRPRDSHYNCMNYDDVTKNSSRFTRCTNPLMPTYTIRDEDGKLTEIGPIHGGSPSCLPAAPKDKDRTSLNIKDIEGAQSSTKGLGIFAHAKR